MELAVLRNATVLLLEGGGTATSCCKTQQFWCRVQQPVHSKKLDFTFDDGLQWQCFENGRIENSNPFPQNDLQVLFNRFRKGLQANSFNHFPEAFTSLCIVFIISYDALNSFESGFIVKATD